MTCIACGRRIWFWQHYGLITGGATWHTACKPLCETCVASIYGRRGRSVFRLTHPKETP
jgi:hypothetical protein